MDEKSKMTLINVPRPSVKALVKLIYIRMQGTTSAAKTGNVREREQTANAIFNSRTEMHFDGMYLSTVLLILLRILETTLQSVILFIQDSKLKQNS